MPLFLSTLSLRRATALRASRQQPAGISIHALLAESDVADAVEFASAVLFLSTLSLRRATRCPCCPCWLLAHFYPRSPCGERHDTSSLLKCQVKFLSTLSLRRATRRSVKLFRQNYISIHALLAESDEVSGDTWQRGSNFYPRSPCGERQVGQNRLRQKLAISIHALLAESDEQTQNLKIPAHRISIHALLAESDWRRSVKLFRQNYISIHALLAESDCYSLRRSAPHWYFYPRSPCGERQWIHHARPTANTISIHALLAESDLHQ